MAELPKVRITFGNGNLGITEPMDDGCAALLATGETTSGFTLGKAYRLTSLAGLEALGIRKPDTSDPSDNDNIYKTVAEFYAEAPAGSPLWLMGVSGAADPDSETDFKAVLATDTPGRPALKLLDAAAGQIRLLMLKPKYVTDGTDEGSGFNDSLRPLVEAAQHLCDYYTEEKYAPLIALVDAQDWTGDLADIEDEKFQAGRVALVAGDTAATGGAALGLVAGRLAAIPVQRCLARVRDNKIAADSLYINGTEANNSMAADLLGLRIIAPRTYVGLPGYYWSDDTLACDDNPASDYGTIARRRVIDKAYRIAYKQCVEYIGEEIPVTSDGKIPGPICKGIEAAVVGAIARQMTAEGNLATDPSDPNDLGVQCTVDPDSPVVASSRLDIKIAVRPYGYAKYIDIDLGFKVGE